jgi:site-specific recombinase XerD
MPITPARTLTTPAARSVYERLLRSYTLSLTAQGMSPRTIETYTHSVRDFAIFLEARGMPLEPHALSREHVEEFIAHLRTATSPLTRRPYSIATANNRHRGLQAFFRWLVEIGELTSSPMVNMRPPRIPESPPATVTVDDVKRILTGCRGNDFKSRRDAAIIMLFMHTGLRRRELARLKLEDIDWAARPDPIAYVMGKGSRPRAVAIGTLAARALDMYTNWARSTHKHAALPELWIGERGAVTEDGIYDILTKRAQAAGVTCHPHQLRHLMAYRWLQAGGSETSLMRHMGWRSPKMVARYTAGTADMLAREEYKNLGIGDKL